MIYAIDKKIQVLINKFMKTKTKSTTKSLKIDINYILFIKLLHLVTSFCLIFKVLKVKNFNYSLIFSIKHTKYTTKKKKLGTFLN